MVMRSISWFRPSTLLRKRGADDLEMGMGMRMVLGIGDCKHNNKHTNKATKTGRQQQLALIPHTQAKKKQKHDDS